MSSSYWCLWKFHNNSIDYTHIMVIWEWKRIDHNLYMYFGRCNVLYRLQGMCLFCKEIKCKSTINGAEYITTVFHLALKCLAKLGFDIYKFHNSEPFRILTLIPKVSSFAQLKPHSYFLSITYFQLLSSPNFNFESCQTRLLIFSSNYPIQTLENM